jgi:hypothetical protein
MPRPSERGGISEVVDTRAFSEGRRHSPVSLRGRLTIAGRNLLPGRVGGLSAREEE